VALVLDTGPLLAALDVDEDHHARCKSLLENSREELIIPAPVLVELDHMIRARLSPTVMIRVLDDIIAGAYRVLDLEPGEIFRVRELCSRYEDSRIGFVDAAVLAIVERLGEPKLATLDHRHFGMMRPRHVSALQLLPE